MASGNTQTSGSSCSDGGVSISTAGTTVNQRYACEWIDTCQRKHELDECGHRRNQLQGKLGIYYSPVAAFNQYVRDEINNLSLEFNPIGCKLIHLLIYKIENNETWLLFVSQLFKKKGQQGQIGNEQLLLAFPSLNPCRRDEMLTEVAERALRTITNENEIVLNVQSHIKRFLFVNANIIYPLYLTNEQANILTEKFSPDDEIKSLHWFRLSTVLDQLPEWNNYVTRQSNGKELALVRQDGHTGIRLIKESEKLTLRPATALCLLSIRNHVGFEEFLKL
ncbi:unnamed protein product [Adineta steineri]|uniref:Uncharacterized protein n=1 Tax=Adineta steineri TaxID=433720 RepID=A0A815AER9_9BILA|nr:unnamed protein product [Adineta steineri]CAF3859743.1 unnamed protein product [Adineta steineri]